MALSDRLLHFVVHSSTENPRSRTVYRPRSEQLVEYLAHASKAREEKDGADQESSSSAEDEKRALDQAEFVKAGVERIRRFEERAAGGAAGGRPGHRQPRQLRRPVPLLLLRRAVPTQPILIRPRPFAAVRAACEQAVADGGRHGEDRRQGPEGFRDWQCPLLPRALCVARLAAEARRFDRQPHLLPLRFSEQRGQRAGFGSPVFFWLCLRFVLARPNGDAARFSLL